MLSLTTLILVSQFLANSSATYTNNIDMQIPAHTKPVNAELLSPRALKEIANTRFGDLVKKGYLLFTNTQSLKNKYVGNELNCSNCHLDAGRKAHSSPMWAAYLSYPAYRKKNNKVNSFAERIQGCFEYSMNGTPPATDSDEIKALSAYAYWLAMSALMEQNGDNTEVPVLNSYLLLRGAKDTNFTFPQGVNLEQAFNPKGHISGRGYPRIESPKLAYDPSRGQAVYAQHCIACHGVDGADVQLSAEYRLPPLWGEGSYNWGAGMHRINTAAYFIYENMPLGKSIQLSVQQAWDVAAFINSQTRPKDPRQNSSIEEDKHLYHQHQGYYGDTVKGHKLGSGSQN